jgi:LysR family transcriptional regulator, glycine cleavage system transcriptional activator
MDRRKFLKAGALGAAASTIAAPAIAQDVRNWKQRGPLVQDALHDGRLVRPFPQTAISQYNYWLVCARNNQEVKKIKLFMDWIKSEAADQPELPEAIDWGSHLKD